MMGNNKNFLKKDYPVAASVGWIKAKEEKTKKAFPSTIVFKEGAQLQKILDHIMVSPTVPMALKEEAMEYIKTRELYENEMLFAVMSIIEDRKKGKK